MFDYWFWGHEHVVAVFSDFQWRGKAVKGRCVGHGGIPYGPTTHGDKGNGINILWTEQKTYEPGKGDPACALNGYAILTLPIAGGDVLETYYDDSGQQRYVVGASV